MAQRAVAIAARYSSCLSVVFLSGGREIASLRVGRASRQRPLAARSIACSTPVFAGTEEAAGAAPCPAADAAASMSPKAIESDREEMSRINFRQKPVRGIQYIAASSERRALAVNLNA